MLMGYAVANRHLVIDPLATVKAPHVERKDPKILTIEQVRSLLEVAWSKWDGECFTYVVLGCFCGIRPHETTKLRWSDIKDANSVVRLSASIAKTREVRAVKIPENARMMLLDWIDRKFANYGEPGDTNPESPVVPCHPNHLRKRFHQVFRNAGIEIWPKDAMRHTFASFYHQATDGDMNALMSRLGHSRPITSLRHYVNLTDEHWLDYFTLTVKKHQQDVIDNLAGKNDHKDPSEPSDRRGTLRKLGLSNEDVSFQERLDALCGNIRD
jgi:integrase